MSSAAIRSGTAARRSAQRLLLTILTSASFILVTATSFSSSTSGDGNQYLDLVNLVDGERIVSTVSDLQDFGSRAFLFSSAWNASIYIHDRFAELGLWVTYQDFQVKGYQQRNVIAVLNGTDPAAPQYLFGAHYDSMTQALLDYEEGNSTYAPGADDDASGLASTIELATVLHEKKFNSTVKFVAFAAEETGLNGSSAFVQKELAEGVLYAGTAIMDMIGYRDSDKNEAFIFRDSSSNTMAKPLEMAASAYGLDLSLTFVSGTNFGASDHYSFWLAGYPSILVIEELADGLPVNPYYHSENDTVDRLSQEQMTVITKALLGGFLELQSLHKEKTSYVEILAISTAAVVAIAMVILLYIIRRRKVVE